MRAKLRRVIPALIVASGCLFYTGSNLADEVLLQSNHGYMLIRLVLTARETVNTLEMSSLDANHVIKIRGKSFKPAGVHAWIAVVAMPSGRYFMSEYEPTFGIAGEKAQQHHTRHRRSAPDSVSETFQIVSGAVNYVGDWEMRVESSLRMQLKPIVRFEKSTLERYLTEYPEHSNRYEIYLSPMGKEAISLGELAKTTE